MEVSCLFLYKDTSILKITFQLNLFPHSQLALVLLSFLGLPPQPSNEDPCTVLIVQSAFGFLTQIYHSFWKKRVCSQVFPGFLLVTLKLMQSTSCLFSKQREELYNLSTTHASLPLDLSAAHCY